MSHQSDLISADILGYLAQHENKEMLRFLTCGNVDDGKSTLIGRLLHDSKMIYEDQLAAIQKDSLKSGTTGDEVDLALLVDGLQAEREQGITIDVTYRYFSTAQRKFIIADTPGHEQYTRNMATGASTCDLAIILVDARYGVQTQTRRHSFIVSLLGIRHVVVAINKMDLVEFKESVFEQIKQDYSEFVQRLSIPDIHFIPLSALRGDNVVNKSEHTPWYQGPSLMELLNTVEISADRNIADVRFPVQWVNRPNLDFRGYSGTLAAGIIKKGAVVMALPSRKSSQVKSIVTFDGELQEAYPGQAITVTLTDEIDISRGDMLVSPEHAPALDSRFNADVVWMAENALVPGKQYYIKQATRTVTGSVSRIGYRIDVNTLEKSPASQLKLNEIGLCEFALSAPLAFDPYSQCKGTGSFIVIDRLSNVTVGAGMIVSLAERNEMLRPVSRADRIARFGQKPVNFWIQGEQAALVALQLERRLFDRGHACIAITEQASAELTAQLNKAGLVCICVGGAQTPAESEVDRIITADHIDFDAIIQTIDPRVDCSEEQPDFDI
jgi:bifunctional enzyme CysN/CysC